MGAPIRTYAAESEPVDSLGEPGRMPRLMKLLMHSGLRVPGVAASLEWLLRDRAAIFTLHRLAMPELAFRGQDPQLLRECLSYLRKHRYELLPLKEIFRRLAGEGPPLRRAVGFTIDDGYLDQAEVGGPIFAEFDCPVTTFVCTGFLDRELWMWWDKIEYVFRHTSRPAVTVGPGEGRTYRWENDTERSRAQYDFTEACKQLPDREKHAAIEDLAVRAEVELPGSAPDEYAPMSWQQLRSYARGSMSFGPHTVTHPILSRVSDDDVRWEIEHSAERLAAECENTDPIFCYPNGQQGDFGAREFRILEDLGFPGAVTGCPGYASAQGWNADPHDRFRVRRFSYPGNLGDMLQCATGAERLKSILRGEGRA